MIQTVPSALMYDATSVAGKLRRSSPTCSASTASRSQRSAWTISRHVPQMRGGVCDGGATSGGLDIQRRAPGRIDQSEALCRQQSTAAAVDAQLRKDGCHMHAHRVFTQP